MPAKKSKSKRVTSVRRPKRKSKSLFSNKAKKQIKKAMGVGIVSLFSILFLGGYGLYRYVSQNIAMADSSSNVSITETMFPSFVYGIIDRQDGSVITLKKLKLVLTDIDSSRVFIYDIPIDLEIDVPGRFTNEEISKVLALGSLNTDDEKEQVSFLIDTLFKIFAFKTEKYIFVTSEYEKEFDDFVNTGNLFTLADTEIISSMKDEFFVNLDLKDLYGLSEILSKIPEDRFITRKLTQEHIESSVIIDDEIREFTINSPLNNERKTIAVLNGTEMPGVASFASRAIHNYGGHVVAVSNADQEYRYSTIIADDPNSETVHLIARLFEIQTIVEKENPGRGNRANVVDRSDIVVILGFDILGDL